MILQPKSLISPTIIIVSKLFSLIIQQGKFPKQKLISVIRCLLIRYEWLFTILINTTFWIILLKRPSFQIGIITEVLTGLLLTGLSTTERLIRSIGEMMHCLSRDGLLYPRKIVYGSQMITPIRFRQMILLQSSSLIEVMADPKRHLRPVPTVNIIQELIFINKPGSDLKT